MFKMNIGSAVRVGADENFASRLAKDGQTSETEGECLASTKWSNHQNWWSWFWIKYHSNGFVLNCV